MKKIAADRNYRMMKEAQEGQSLSVVAQQYVDAAMQIPAIKASVKAGTLKFDFGPSRSCLQQNFREFRAKECMYVTAMMTSEYNYDGDGELASAWKAMGRKHSADRKSNIIYKYVGSGGSVDPSWGEDPKWTEVVRNIWLVQVEYPK